MLWSSEWYLPFSPTIKIMYAFLIYPFLLRAPPTIFLDLILLIVLED
jgi:hypothetical protein